jgi:predicted RNA-binding Zn ribbon-like protein
MHHWKDSDLIGGHVALDFINTVSDVGKSRRETRLATWKDYSDWLAAAGIERSGTSNGMKVSRSASLAELHELREISYCVFHELAAGSCPEKEHLDQLRDYIEEAIRHAELMFVDGELRWSPQKTDGNSQFHRIVFLIDDLLRGGELHRLRECGRCTWLFLDTGRGLGRKWCDMRTCGNRAKSESFRYKRLARQPRST